MNVLLATIVLASTTLVPLNDLGTAPYLWGYYGGLWDNGGNVGPSDHLAAGVRRAALIEPRDANGVPSPQGKIVFLAVGYGNTELTFNAFADMARANRHVNQNTLALVNVARPGFDGWRWSNRWDHQVYPFMQQQIAEAGYTNAQVQAAWIQMINERPGPPLGIAFGDAYLIKADYAETLRNLKDLFPNLQIAYLSSAEYAGYDTSGMLREPHAYEGGFSVRWAVEGQVTFVRDGWIWDTRIGNLNYDQGMSPWITWGPYLWANGTTPRSDGLIWERDDFDGRGFALSAKGARKSATELLNFLLREPTAARWFRISDPPTTRPRPVRH